MMLARFITSLGFAAGLLSTAVGSPARAQTYTIVSVGSNQPNFGALAAATSGTTVFEIDPDGFASVQSGSGGVIPGARSGATVVVRCMNGSGSSRSCANNNQAMLKVAKRATVSGRTHSNGVSNFTVQSNDLAVDWIATQGDGSLQVRLTGLTHNTNKTVYIGMNLPILGDTSSTATTATAGWTVGIAKWDTVPTLPGTNGTATATVRRSLAASTTPMSFGFMTRPATGTGTMTLDASTGVRTPGGANPPGAVSGGSPGRGTVVVTGQPSTSFTITLPGSFTLSNGTTTLTATPTRTATGTLTLSGAGTYTLGVGAVLTLTSAATTGAYTGAITATVAYN